MEMGEGMRTVSARSVRPRDRVQAETRPYSSISMSPGLSRVLPGRVCVKSACLDEGVSA
jgi:hypothetical protein